MRKQRKADKQLPTNNCQLKLKNILRCPLQICALSNVSLILSFDQLPTEIEKDTTVSFANLSIEQLSHLS